MRMKEKDRYKSVQSAVNRAIKECKEEGVLTDFFEKHDADEITDAFFYEFEIQRQREMDRRDGREEGRACIISGALRMGRTPEQIAEFTGISLEEVKKVQEEMLEEA